MIDPRAHGINFGATGQGLDPWSPVPIPSSQPPDPWRPMQLQGFGGGPSYARPEDDGTGPPPGGGGFNPGWWGPDGGPIDAGPQGGPGGGGGYGEEDTDPKPPPDGGPSHEYDPPPGRKPDPVPWGGAFNPGGVTNNPPWIDPVPPNPGRVGDTSPPAYDPLARYRVGGVDPWTPVNEGPFFGRR